MNACLGIKAMLAVLATALALPAAAATTIPEGRWSFVFHDAKGQSERPVRVYTYRPLKCDTKCPIVFVMHGAKRNAYDYSRYWELAADRHRFLLVAPEFAQKDWPRSAYNLGDMAEQRDPGKWTYSVVEHLFDEVRDGHAGYTIFGHSAGGQFVHRMALFLPDNRATVMVAANPGWYAMPEWRKDKTKAEFPYSLAGSPAGEANVRKALARRMLLLVGEKDSDPDADNLNESAGAKAQGEGRLERGENFFKAATALSQELGVPLAWELHEVPETVHDGAAMSRHAAALLYGKK
jgi:poly(3-hydroxybutyrate) depolymerase